MKKAVYSLWFIVYGMIILLSAIRYPLSACYAQPISSQELIEHAKEYDGKTVEFEGEVIGDIMARRDGVWLNVNDGANAIGIWADKISAGKIKFAGDYNDKGDYLRVTGEFHRACREHGGDLDIHSTNLELLKAGAEIKRKIDFTKLNVGIALSVVASILAAGYLIRKVFSKGR